MIDVTVNNDNILIQIPKNLISNSYLEKFLERLEVEEIAEKNQMTEDQAWNMSEEIKETWYKENEKKLSDIIKKYEKNRS
jgi:hypothetical protein